VVKKELKNLFPMMFFIAMILSTSIYCKFFTDTFEPIESASTKPGDFATSYLRSDRYSSLEIEIDYVSGVHPNETAIEEFVKFIDGKKGGICAKSKGIKYQIDDEIPLSDYNVKLVHEKYHYYTQDDISAIEERYRDKYRQLPKLTLYILYLDAPFKYEVQGGIVGSSGGDDNNNYEDDGRILGRAHHASTIVIFKNESLYNLTLLNTTTEPPHPEKIELDKNLIEQAVLMHEFGHLVTLVSYEFHEDEEHAQDCKNVCVMNYNVDHLSDKSPYVVNSSSSWIPFLCKDCLDEINKLKNG
jgi:hypothetical protein